MNIFNGKLDIYSSMLVDGTTDQWNLQCAMSDNSGVFFATDTLPGDVVFIDGTGFNQGVMRYAVVTIDWGQTDFNNLYITIRWDDYAEPLEPLSGFDACICRLTNGAAFIPSAAIQGVSQSFVDYIRNTEHARMSQVSWMNRTFNGVFLGEQDGFNQVFQIQDSYIEGTLVVYANGVQMNLGVDADTNDYIMLAPGQVQLTLAPGPKDILTFNYNKKNSI
jgi:hypothetical protein